MSPYLSVRRGGWLLTAALVLLLSGCASVEREMRDVLGIQRPARQVPSKPPAGTVDTWTGTYRGVLPCSDCQGLRLSLSLFKDATYELQTEMMGTDKRFSRSGSFMFNADETRITLDANGQNRSFEILPPNRLRMLDKSGKAIAGQEAERFILRK